VQLEVAHKTTVCVLYWNVCILPCHDLCNC